MNTLSQIRRTAIARANTLQRCHRALPQLRTAFAEWNAGDIYICRKTGSYRYRFGDISKSIAPWDALARETFATPSAFAFAALVLGPAEAPSTRSEKPAQVTRPVSSGRANIIALAA